MLINCVECGKEVSDKAYFCPHCGYPINPTKSVFKEKRKKKLPNGFGQISKITGRNLRKPYRAIITVGHTNEGKPIQKLLKPIAYFATYNEAYEALVENNKSPYDRLKDLTFFELYEKWYAEKKDTIGESRQESYNCSIKHLKPLWKMKMTEIKPVNIKEVISSIDSSSTQKNLKILLNQMFDYAVENEIVEKNYARITKVNVDLNKIKNPHRSLSSEEIDKIIKNISKPIAQMLLILCYSGMRPGELLDLKIENINLEENYMIGGKKTKAGINRTIPIHPMIKENISEFYTNAKRKESEYLVINIHGGQMTYRNFLILFNQFCSDENINGLRPHDCRKYFVTQAKKYHLDEYAIKRIVGHEINDITEKVYTERSNEWLLEQISMIPSLSVEKNEKAV